jgi:hypothetical protein
MSSSIPSNVPSYNVFVIKPKAIRAAPHTPIRIDPLGFIPQINLSEANRANHVEKVKAISNEKEDSTAKKVNPKLNLYKKWTEEEQNLLIQIVNKKQYSWKKIGEMMGRSEKSVGWKWSALKASEKFKDNYVQTEMYIFKEYVPLKHQRLKKIA